MYRLIFLLIFSPLLTDGQTVEQKILKAYTAFERDSQLKYAIGSLYVIDAKTGKVVIDKNSRIGLAPASTQKIITSVTAFEILGPEYKYKTDFYIDNGFHHYGDITIVPSGDPTLGSWRWDSTTTSSILQRLVPKLIAYKVPKSEVVRFRIENWNHETIPGGWIMDDIGNYYGAGASAFNWRENQYDIFLRSGKYIGDSVHVVSTNPAMKDLKYISYVTSAIQGSGDNAYVYYDLKVPGQMIIRGTIPINETKFPISASLISGSEYFVSMLNDTLRSLGKLTDENAPYLYPIHTIKKDYDKRSLTKIHTEISPSLDSIIYYFNQRSINLYGEALLKTIANKTYNVASTDSGVAVVKNFWKSKRFDADELNIQDGSGLSPQNRVTTHALVEILKYAYKRPWYPALYKSLPVFNQMKLKSGTINRVKAFTGVHKAKNGREYLIAFIVNNYNGSASSLVNKMYKVLDTLK